MKKIRIQKIVKVFVALSGGVDSSVACALLKEQGYDVTAVFMRCWLGDAGGMLSSSCTTEQDERDARRVAVRLGIPFLVFDLRKEYKKEVADYMINGYRRGITPNPDVMCNKYIKFGLFLKKAVAMGADMIATGHYVRLRRATQNSFHLLEAKDKNKDQSYFLWRLTQGQLKRCLFPVGNFIKPEIRELAKKFRLPTAGKKDSQGICFIGKVTLFDFLKKHIKPKKGIIIGPDGRAIGEHNGAWYYTIGQRGFGVGGAAQPLYVVKKDIRRNILYVGHKDDKRLYGAKLFLKEVHWIAQKPKLPFRCKARIRYRQELAEAVVSMLGKRTVISFSKPQFAPARGQSVVFYSRRNAPAGRKVLGGGVIA
jgi:tRNA-specific 2-thiouridylase